MTEQLTASEAETAAAGAELGRTLQAGDLVLLEGDLGAGKTAFVRGLVAGLGGDPAAVSSPTFALVQEYAARVAVQHVDLYRLTPVEVDDLALDELLEGAVMAVEWPDRWHTAPEPAAHVSIARVDDATRRITVRRYSTR
jgi:tRNA threonylcarbamoyl adenosine modification protein YjeE